MSNKLTMNGKLPRIPSLSIINRKIFITHLTHNTFPYRTHNFLRCEVGHIKKKTKLIVILKIYIRDSNSR